MNPFPSSRGFLNEKPGGRRDRGPLRAHRAGGGGTGGLGVASACQLNSSEQVALYF